MKKIVGVSTLSRSSHGIAQTRDFECTKLVFPEVLPEVSESCYKNNKTLQYYHFIPVVASEQGKVTRKSD